MPPSSLKCLHHNKHLEGDTNVYNTTGKEIALLAEHHCAVVRSNAKNVLQSMYGHCFLLYIKNQRIAVMYKTSMSLICETPCICNNTVSYKWLSNRTMVVVVCIP